MASSRKASVRVRTFHVRDGVEFTRIETNERPGVEFALWTGRGTVTMMLADFASVVAAMTPQGDTAETFSAAERFLLTGKFDDPRLDRGEK